MSENTDFKCKNCRYWDKSDDFGSFCRRYPEAIRKCSFDWCGEFKPKAGERE